MVELIIQQQKARNQKVLILAVCTLLCFQPIVFFVNQLCRVIFGSNFTLDTFLCYLALACILLAGVKQLHFQIKTDALLLVIVFAIAYVFSYSFGENTQRYLFTSWSDFAGNPLYLLFVYSLPAYVFMRYITDYESLVESFRFFSLAVILCSFASFFLMFQKDRQPEYMNFSYNLLFSTLFSAAYYLEKKKILSLIAAIVGLLLIFLVGARGPLVCFLFGFFVYFLTSKISIGKKVVALFLLLAFSLAVMLLWQQILQSLQDLVQMIGISSRTVDMLASGEFSDDSGRLAIFRQVIESFTLFGRGLYGDRIAGENHYAHNLLLELISQWGYLFGTLIIILLCVLLYNGFKTKNASLKLLLLVFFSSGVVKLMLSGSYLAHNAVFYTLLAACVNTIEEKETLPVAEGAEHRKKKSKYIKAYNKYG